MTQLTVAGEVPAWHQGDFLRKAREHAGLSQAELAEVTGISRRTVVRYESGEAVVRRPQLIAWAMATGVPLAWLNGESPRQDGGPEGGSRVVRPKGFEPPTF
ncbi:helix-turn-helix domain-containing protein [Cellulosimicrobium cellulans]|uniref:helix-turn-helix domain-containing protein n=1 Tax=Cellulosimicrobium cellulans TaxID=1710 RepID=UPI003648362F